MNSATAIQTDDVIEFPISEQVLQARRQLAQQIFDSRRDPAPRSPDEILLYTGVDAVISQREGHQIYLEAKRIEAESGIELAVPKYIEAREITEKAKSRTGIDIHPGAEIGTGFFIDHGQGVVIGETAVLGKFVTMYQGVVLGAVAPGNNKPGEWRHPHVGDNVLLGCYTKVIGAITIGDGTKIDSDVYIRNASIGERGKISAGTKIDGRYKIGDEFVAGPAVIILGKGKLGNHVNIGIGSKLLRVEFGNNVKIGENAQLQKVGLGDDAILGENTRIYNSNIANNVKVGNNVSINGATIGEGAIIEDNAVISADVLPGEIVRAGTVKSTKSSVVEIDFANPGRSFVATYAVSRTPTLQQIIAKGPSSLQLDANIVPQTFTFGL